MHLLASEVEVVENKLRKLNKNLSNDKNFKK